MLLDITNLGILADMEGMDAVVNGVFWAAVIDTATSNNSNVSIVADIEVVDNGFFVTGFLDDDWDMDDFVSSISFDGNDETVFLRFDVNII